jgi:hypothetical protein
MKGKTQTHYDSNPESKKKKAKYDKEFNKKPEQRAKRSELTTRNRKADEKGVDRNGKDFDHAVGKYVKSSVNRGRKEKSRLKK